MAYKDVILLDNPVAYFRLGDSAGAANAIDATGHGWSGTFDDVGEIEFGKPGLLVGDPDTAIQLAPATPETVMCGITTPLTGFGAGGLMSVEAWIQVVGLPSGGFTAAIAGNGKDTDVTAWALYVDSSGRLCFQYYTSGGGFNGIAGGSAPTLPGDPAIHVVATYDGGIAKLYVQGQLKASAIPANIGPIVANGDPFLIGHRFRDSGGSTAADSFLGVLDEVAFYPYALTPTQVYDHYLAGLGETVPPPVYATPNDDRHYFAVQIYDSTGTMLLDLPQTDLDSLKIEDVVNGGSGQGTIAFRRDFNDIGNAAYLNRVLVWFWHGGIARPADPYYAGYMVDLDQEKTATSGLITWQLNGDAKQLDRGDVTESINPLINGNGNLDAADYIRHILDRYAPPGFLQYSVPSAMFPLLPYQFTLQHVGAVIDTIVKSGRDDVGQMWTWRVRSNWRGYRTFIVQPDQNPNKLTGLLFIHVFRDGMCEKYTISTKYRDIVNVILVTGARDPNTGQTVQDVFEDSASVAEWGPWEDGITVPAIVNSDACQAYGEAYLDLHANPQAQGEIVLWKPDPRIFAGTWIQTWELPTVIKQLRIGSVSVEMKPSRVVQTLSPTAPTPYLDEAVYKMGLKVQGAISSMQRGLSTNTQQNYVRLGGAGTIGP